MFSISEDGEIDLSSTEALWDWWHHGTTDLEFSQASWSPGDTKSTGLIGKTNGPPRMEALSDHSNSRSWQARSRARVARGLLLTSTGISRTILDPEIIEDKYWSDISRRFLGTSEGPQSDKAVDDYLRFARDLGALCGAQPALRGNQVNVFHVHQENGVVAFHRWLEGSGQDLVVVVSLNESTWWKPSPRLSTSWFVARGLQ